MILEVQIQNIFENAQTKVIDSLKRHFGHFWRLITFFVCFFKITDLNNMCAFIVFKAKTKEKYEEHLL